MLSHYLGSSVLVFYCYVLWLIWGATQGTLNYWVIQSFIMDSIKHLRLNALEKKFNSYKSYQGNIHVYFLIRFLWNNFHHASERGVYSNMSHSRFCVTVVKFLFCSNIYVVFSWWFCWKSSCITDNSNDTV